MEWRQSCHIEVCVQIYCLLPAFAVILHPFLHAMLKKRRFRVQAFI